MYTVVVTVVDFALRLQVDSTVADDYQLCPPTIFSSHRAPILSSCLEEDIVCLVAHIVAAVDDFEVYIQMVLAESALRLRLRTLPTIFIPPRPVRQSKLLEEDIVCRVLVATAIDFAAC